MSRSQWPAKTPIIPTWCDYHSYTLHQKLIFFGITRAIVALTSFCLCVAFLATFDCPEVLQVLLSLICILNIIQILIMAYFSYVASTGNPKVIQTCSAVDIATTIIFLMLVLVTLFFLPPEKLFIILGIKLIVLSVLLCYRHTMNSITLREQPFQVYM